MTWFQSFVSSLSGGGGISVLAMLLGLLLPACGARGPAGLPPATPIDWSTLKRPTSPNSALAAPEGFAQRPDIATRRYDTPPPVLLAALRRVAEAQPRVFSLASFEDRLQAAYVARSAVWNFPDIIYVAAVPDGGGSAPVIYSRSVYGRYDLGVNRHRVETWLAQVPGALRSEAP